MKSEGLKNKLFVDKIRVDLDPAFHNENHFDYYDRSARNDISKIRQVLDEWFSNYPVSEQSELKSRFKKTFSSAFFELFIHELFRMQGFEITVHPIVPNSNKRPDFLLSKNGFEFYLEAKEARDKSHAEDSLDRKINRFYDSLNKVNSPYFLLKIEELLLKSEKQPSTKKVIEKIEAEVIKHDPDNMLENLAKFGSDGKIQVIHEDSDLKVVVSLIPKLPAFRKPGEGRPIGMYPPETFWGGSEESIKSSFTKKAKRYGEMDKPYLICINAVGLIGNGDFDIENAVWGSVAYAWSTNPNKRDERWERLKDGIFLNEKGPRNKNVSGVLLTKVVPFNISVASHLLAKHPFSENDLNFDLFDLSYTSVKDGKITKVNNKTIGEVLELDSSWLPIESFEF